MSWNRRAFCQQVVMCAGLGTAGEARSEMAIDRAIRAALREWQVPGVAVGIIREDRIEYLGGHGLRRQGEREPVTPDTLFPLGSCSKAFISTVLAILVDEGRLDWDDPVRKHLPEFRLADPLADRQVTLRDLTCHRTGLATHDLLWYRAAWPPEEAVRRAGRLPLDRPFRSTFQYQSTMYAALGLVVSAAAGQPWQEFIQKRLFAPLAMKTAGCSTASFRSEDRAAGHRADEHRADARGEREPLAEWVPFPRPDGAASIHASARELCSWLRLHLSEGSFQSRRLVSAGSLRETHTPQMVIRQSESERALHPESEQASYGMGWVIQDYQGHRLVAHSGILDGFRVQLTMAPRARLGLVILANLHATRMNLALGYTLLDLLLDLKKRDWNGYLLGQLRKQEEQARRRRAEFWSRRHQDTEPSRPLADYTGEFVHPAYGIAKLTLDRGRLRWRWSTFHGELEHFHHDTFLLRHPHLGEVVFTFALNARAEVTEVSMPDWFGIAFRRRP